MNGLPHLLRSCVRGTSLYRPLALLYRRYYYNPLFERQRFANWNKEGRRGPPPHLAKRDVILKYARETGTRTLVETGTYLGLMVNAMKGKFDEIYSIELEPFLAARAKRKFGRHSHIHIVEGDSGVVLPAVLKKLQSPALFWLDGHASGGITAHGEAVTPLMMELDTILTHSIKGHTILIDDARCFGHDDGYPELQEVESKIKALCPNAEISVAEDVIRVKTPGSP